MKKEIADKWIAALRSGDYKQGRHALRSIKNRFCCLGVLCNLHALEHPELAATQPNPQVYFGACGVLPHEVMEWAGIRDSAGFIGSIRNSLTVLNDDHMYTFKQIADIIERHRKEL